MTKLRTAQIVTLGYLLCGGCGDSLFGGPFDEAPEECLPFVEEAYSQGFEEGVASVPPATCSESRPPVEVVCTAPEIELVCESGEVTVVHREKHPNHKKGHTKKK